MEKVQNSHNKNINKYRIYNIVWQDLQSRGQNYENL